MGGISTHGYVELHGAVLCMKDGKGIGGRKNWIGWGIVFNY